MTDCQELASAIRYLGFAYIIGSLIRMIGSVGGRRG